MPDVREDEEDLDLACLVGFALGSVDRSGIARVCDSLHRVNDGSPVGSYIFDLEIGQENEKQGFPLLVGCRWVRSPWENRNEESGSRASGLYRDCYEYQLSVYFY